jgi:hypothetical protein
MRPPILMDFPQSFETERLVIRSPCPSDGPEVYAAVRESIEELTPWMAWPKEHKTVNDSEASVRRSRVAFLVHLQYRFRVVSYSSGHEISNLRTFTFGKGA